MTNAADKAYSAIRSSIVSGKFGPGTRLKEELLAEKSGVSRTPIREALRSLASEGLVQMIPNSGYYVTSWTSHDISRICTIRALLESEAARLAAANITYAQLEQLRALADEMTALAKEHVPDSIAKIASLNREFHHLILVVANYDRLLTMASQMMELPISFRNFESYKADEMMRSMAHHHEITTAFEHKDAEWASAVMKSHILASKYSLLSKFVTPVVVGDGVSSRSRGANNEKPTEAEKNRRRSNTRVS